MKLIYVAGKFRGKTKYDVKKNVDAAEAVGLEVAKLGCMPVIPHKNTENFDGQLSDEFWIEGTLELLRRCDAVVLVDASHFETSVGTRGEVDEANRLGKPVFWCLDDLEHWLDQQRCEKHDLDDCECPVECFIDEEELEKLQKIFKEKIVRQEVMEEVVKELKPNQPAWEEMVRYGDHEVTLRYWWDEEGYSAEICVYGSWMVIAEAARLKDVRTEAHEYIKQRNERLAPPKFW